MTRRTRRLLWVLTVLEVDALSTTLRTHRDRAMVAVMVFGGLRRGEVPRLRLEDLREGNGGCSSLRARAGTSGWSPIEFVDRAVTAQVWRRKAFHNDRQPYRPDEAALTPGRPMAE